MNVSEASESKAVGRLSESLALGYGYKPEQARLIRNAAVLHDIGKKKISESILTKPASLDTREFEIIKTHTKLGAEMLSKIKGEIGDMARLICLYHHEWYDPTMGGYWGVPVHSLPDYVSFVAISDVYTALTASRLYKEAWTRNDALMFIQNHAG
jgi:putative two-component system response regulator